MAASSQSALGQIVQIHPMDMGNALSGALASAGDSISKGVDYMTNLKMRSDAASDTLQALHSNGTIDQKTYESVAGKALGAREAMVGMYTAKALADQAAGRQEGLQQTGAAAQGSQERQTQAAALQGQLQAYQQGVPSTLSKSPVMPATGTQPPQAAPAGSTMRQRKLSSGAYAVYQVDANGKVVGVPQTSPTQAAGVPLDN